MKVRKIIAGWMLTMIAATTGFAAQDIVDTAVAADGFNTLVAAVKAGGLVETLKGQGPFTVFAPTDAAFAKLPPGTLDSLLKPENKGKLVDILTYHVVPGKVLSGDVVKLSKATTVEGKDVAIRVENGSVYINDSKVVTVDIECTNGVIHVIDSVLLPPSASGAKDIVDTAVTAGSFSTLVAAVKAAGLVETLKGKGPFTVFAPTDEAFAKLPKETLQSLLKPENKAKLAGILTYHVVPGKVLAADVVNLTSAKTVQGASVKIAVVNGQVKIDKATVVKTDIECANGVIHVIDAVILPPENFGQMPSPRTMIADAIAHGAPVYNAGDHCQCAAIYMTTVERLVNEHGGALPQQVQTTLMSTLTEARQVSSSDSRAWVLRRGMDQAYMALAN